MTDLPFKLIDKPHAPGYTRAWVEFDSGFQRPASDVEEQLWAALQEARAHLDEHDRKGAGKGRK